MNLLTWIFLFRCQFFHSLFTLLNDAGDDATTPFLVFHFCIFKRLILVKESRPPPILSNCIAAPLSLSFQHSFALLYVCDVLYTAASIFKIAGISSSSRFSESRNSPNVQGVRLPGERVRHQRESLEGISKGLDEATSAARGQRHLYGRTVCNGLGIRSL